MVHPGPNGPISTRQSEAVREGWEDYCLLSLLHTQHKEQALEAILQSYQENKASLTEPRQRALRAAAAD